MPYRVEIGGKANAQLAELDAAIGASVERKIQWLSENAAVMVIADWLEYRQTWLVFASFVWVITAFFIGIIRPRNWLSNIALKFIAVSKPERFRLKKEAPCGGLVL